MITLLNVRPFLSAGGIIILALSTPLSAQPVSKGSGWGARMVLQPIVMAYGGFAVLCSERAAARPQWGVEQIEKVVAPTEQQRAALAELKAAAADAIHLT